MTLLISDNDTLVFLQYMLLCNIYNFRCSLHLYIADKLKLLVPCTDMKV